MKIPAQPPRWLARFVSNLGLGAAVFLFSYILVIGILLILSYIPYWGVRSLVLGLAIYSLGSALRIWVERQEK